MPTKISNAVQGSPKERLDKFRQTIPDGEGYSYNELATLSGISASRNRIADIVRENRWGIEQYDVRARRMTQFLVNPKMLAKYKKPSK